MSTNALPTGTTVYLIRGTKYVGVWHDAKIVPAADVPEVNGPADGWFAVIDARGTMALATPDDMFETEADARAAAKSRRKPRQPRQARALYGDFAQLAAFNGIATDGTGRRAR